MEEVSVSTDGSCVGQGGSGHGAIGWAVVEHGGALERAGGAAFGTNQIAELTAILVALRTYQPGSKRAVRNLTIYSDSKYAINSATTWIQGWKQKGWKRTGNKPITNLAIIQAIDRELELRHQNGGTAQLIWVKAHNGDEYNEAADELANSTAHTWRKKLGTPEEEDLSTVPKEARQAILERAQDLGFTNAPVSQDFDLLSTTDTDISA
ncbi:MAG: ribonuclease HI [Candidatus Ancillula sp.]|jgi:ribonuclease HI|nr:ribonuclease HI [Candidatus Ancillula sp.]